MSYPSGRKESKKLQLNFMPLPELQTERLQLKSLALEDEEEILKLRSNEVVNKYIDRKPAASLADARDFIQRILTGVGDQVRTFWTIYFEKESKLIGTICLWNINEEAKKAEIGYEMLPQYHGKGIMQEAMKKVLDFGFATMGLVAIEAYTNDQNSASIRLLQRNGFIKTGVDPENKGQSIYLLTGKEK
jgi:ribosomal-protein-alanine N-acetyltransferase